MQKRQESQQACETHVGVAGGVGVEGREENEEVGDIHLCKEHAGVSVEWDGRVNVSGIREAA